jgi:hypothetical protein
MTEAEFLIQLGKRQTLFTSSTRRQNNPRAFLRFNADAVFPTPLDSSGRGIASNPPRLPAALHPQSSRSPAQILQNNPARKHSSVLVPRVLRQTIARLLTNPKKGIPKNWKSAATGGDIAVLTMQDRQPRYRSCYRVTAESKKIRSWINWNCRSRVRAQAHFIERSGAFDLQATRA